MFIEKSSMFHMPILLQWKLLINVGIVRHLLLSYCGYFDKIITEMLLISSPEPTTAQVSF